MTFWMDLTGFTYHLEYVDAGGLNTRVLRAGKGEPVICLHGISGHLEAFVPMVRHYVNDFELHAIDMAGHGYTQSPGGPVTMDTLCDHIVAYMDAAHIEKAHFVGISLGGWVSAWLAAHHPERILTTTLIAPPGDPHSPVASNPAFVEHLRKITREGVLGTDKEFTRKRLAAVLTNPDVLTDELVDVRYAIYHQPTFQAGIEDLMALTHLDQYEKFSLTPGVLAKIKSEVLVVWGENDPSGDGTPFLREGLARKKIVFFKKTGHLPPYERAEDFARVNLAFLKHGLAGVEEGSI